MSELKKKLSEAMKLSLKEKNKEKLSTIRLILSVIKKEEIDSKTELTDERILSILGTEVKKRRESIKQYTKAERSDLAEKEEAEIKVIQEFLPPQLSDEEITKIVQDTIKDSEATNIKDLPKVMQALKPRLQGRADMSKVSKNVKEALS